MYGSAAHMAEAWKEWEGTVVDGFRLEEFLGGSDHSAVFSSHSPHRVGEKVVLKFVPVTPENLELQRVSWESAARVEHPHLIQLHGTGRCRLGNTEFLYLVMEYAEENLAQILPERALSPEEVRKMLPSVLETLSLLHRKGLVHGALKPSNFLAAGDQLKLASDHVWPVSKPRPQVEHNAYEAPEFTRGEVTPSSDVWSLGMALSEILTRRSPNGKYPPAVDALPQPFSTIVSRCLEADPAQRCALSDISRALTAPPVSSTPSPGAAIAASAPAPQSVQRDSAPWVPASGASRLWKRAALLVVLLTAVYVGSRLFRGRSDERSSPPPAAVSTTPALESSPTTGETQPPAATPASGAHAAEPGAGTPGTVRERVHPRVSASALATITGKVRVRALVKVDPAGKVTEAKLESAGPSRYFASRSLDAARGWTFNPPERDGHPVPSQWRLRFQYSRTGSEMFADQVSH
jgi:TonB family protein